MCALCSVLRRPLWWGCCRWEGYSVPQLKDRLKQLKCTADDRPTGQRRSQTLFLGPRGHEGLMEYLCQSVRQSARKIWITYIKAYMHYESSEDSSNQPHHSPVPPSAVHQSPVPPSIAQYRPVHPSNAQQSPGQISRTYLAPFGLVSDFNFLKSLKEKFLLEHTCCLFGQLEKKFTRNVGPPQFMSAGKLF